MVEELYAWADLKQCIAKARECASRNNWAMLEYLLAMAALEADEVKPGRSDARRKTELQRA